MSTLGLRNSIQNIDMLIWIKFSEESVFFSFQDMIHRPLQLKVQAPNLENIALVFEHLYEVSFTDITTKFHSSKMDNNLIIVLQNL